MAPFKLALPGWLVSLILSAFAYLRGRDDQEKADAAAAEKAAAKNQQIVETATEEVKKLDPTAVQKELDEWQAKD